MFEKFEQMKTPQETSPTTPSPEKPHLKGPSLRYLDKAFAILRQPEVGPTGEETWRELAPRVRPFESALELSDNIREVVVDFVSKKFPLLKEKVPAARELTDKELLETLVAGEAGEKTDNKEQQQVLLAAAAHVVKRIENYTHRKVLKETPLEKLEKLGLDASSRDLLLEVLDTAIKADPLYIRFMAYAQLTPQPPEGASAVALHLPGKEGLYTLASLFPHETQFLSKRFTKIATEGGEWVQKQGGEIFQKYLQKLGDFYSEENPEKAEEKQKEIENLYRELLKTDFPIILTPATEGFYKEPYFDPELKVSIASPEARKEELAWREAQKAMSESLDALGANQFAEGMLNQPVRGAMVMGGFGVNITFNAVAQEKPTILVFLNEQIRVYDRNFPETAAKLVGNTSEIFGEPPSPEKRALLEKISRTDTVLHELAHFVYPDDGEEAKRLGRKPLTVVDEVKAEITYRALVPSIIEKGGLEGTKKEWAVGMLASSLNMIREEPKNDPYYLAAAYALNGLFEKGAVRMENGKAVITDFDLYYQAQKAAAENLLSVYRDPQMTEQKAAQWIKKYCLPNKKVKEALKTFRV